MRLLPGSTEAVVLVGTLLPVSADPAHTLLFTSPETHRVFDADDREGLEKFTHLQSIDDAIAAMKSIGGNSGDLDDWVDSGLLARFPGTFTPAEFREAFTGLALVWPTDAKAAWIDGDTVHLTVPGDEGTIRVSALLYSLAPRSNGRADLPKLLRKVTSGQEALDELTCEVIVKLRFLVNNGLAAIIRAG